MVLVWAFLHILKFKDKVKDENQVISARCILHDRKDEFLY